MNIIVQAAGSHWRQNPATNANIMAQAKVSPKKLYLDTCMKSVHTTGAS